MTDGATTAAVLQQSRMYTTTDASQHDNTDPLYRPVVWFRLLHIFPPISCYISELVQDRDTVPCQKLPTRVQCHDTVKSTFSGHTTTDCTCFAVQQSATGHSLVATACAWNALPHWVSSAPSLPTFRQLLKMHLFHRNFYL